MLLPSFLLHFMPYQDCYAHHKSSTEPPRTVGSSNNENCAHRVVKIEHRVQAPIEGFFSRRSCAFVARLHHLGMRRHYHRPGSDESKNVPVTTYDLVINNDDAESAEFVGGASKANKIL